MEVDQFGQVFAFIALIIIIPILGGYITLMLFLCYLIFDLLINWKWDTEKWKAKFKDFMENYAAACVFFSSIPAVFLVISLFYFVFFYLPFYLLSLF